MKINRKFGIQYHSCDVCDQRAVLQVVVVKEFASIHNLKKGLKYDLCRQCAIENHRLQTGFPLDRCTVEINAMPAMYSPWLEKTIEV